MALPSESIISATKPIWVRDTGDVDQDYYPLFTLLSDSTENGHRTPVNVANGEKLEDAPIRRYGLVDSPRPKFVHSVLQKKDGMIWISGRTVDTKKEADHPSIDRDDPLYDSHTPGFFHSRGEQVIYSLNEAGLAARASGQNLVPSGTGITYYSRGLKARYKVHSNVRNHPPLWLDSNLYHIRRARDVTPSPLRRLFHVEVIPESVFMAWKLKDILYEMGIALGEVPLIIVQYLPLKYQRDVYLDTELFDKVLNSQSDSENDDFRKIADALCRKNISKSRQSSVWRDDDHYYRSMISDVAQRQIASPHPLLSQNARLPQITPSGRGHIGIVAKRLDMVLKPNTNLYGYQLHTVLWCHELERSILAKQSLCVGSNDLQFCSGSNCAVYVHEESGACTSARKRRPIENVSYSTARGHRAIEPRIVHYGGGIVADDVGLGKSLSMLSLIAAHPFKDDITKSSFDENTGTLEYGPDGDTVRCAATLVVAPNHLIHQWKDEIDRHFTSNSLNVVTITTKKTHLNVTYRHLLEAHVVLVSASFLNGNYYQTTRETFAQNWIPEREKHWTLIEQKASSNSTSKHDQQTKWCPLRGPFLDLLHWRRFILDEGHEILLKSKARGHIRGFKSDFKWYCTGTPFPSDQIMEYAAHFLDIRLNGELIPRIHQKRSFSLLHNVIYHHLYSRHTKESIATDDHLPDIQETCELIEFHPIERILYEATRKLRGTKLEDLELERAICSGALEKIECGLFIPWQRKLWGAGNSMRVSIIQFYQSNLKHLLRINKRNCTVVIEKLIEKREHIEKIKKKRIPKLEKYQKEVDEMKKRFKKQNIPWNPNVAWLNATDQYKHSNLQYKLNMAKKEVALWTEGMEIWPSIGRILQKNISGKIREFESNIASEPRGSILLEIMRQYGSKQALLLQFVQQILQDRSCRIIIFSLFGMLLQVLKKRLERIGIHAALCSGNVYSRRKAMRAFQKEIDPDGEDAANRVILLSSRCAASGSNLNLATHVILVDPIPGASSESFAQERQAIGRAVRQGMDERGIATKVIRLVVQDSIEQETHERNAKVREQQNTELHSNNGVKREGHNYDSSLLDGLKIEDRTNEEIEFFVNIREYAEQYKKAMDSSDSKKKTTQNAIVTVSRKRPRSAVVKRKNKSLPVKMREDMQELPKKQRRVKREKRSNSSNAERQPSEPVYCVCRRPHSTNEFMIQCDRCDEWYHGECIGVTEADADEIDEYECFLCSGPPKKKRKVNRRRRRQRKC